MLAFRSSRSGSLRRALPTTPSFLTSVAAPVCRGMATVSKPSAEELIKRISAEENQSIQKLVPWFLEQMPDAYFQQVSESTRVEHLKALSALYRASAPNLDFTVTTENANGDRDVTFVRHTNTVGMGGN